MKPNKPVNIRNFEGSANSFGGGQQQITPFMPESQFSQYLPAAAQPAKSGSGLLSNLNFNQIKTIIDRMGGIEGVMETVAKVQKVVQTLQQIGPMLKVLLPKLGSKTGDNEDYDDDYPRRRRRRRRRRRASSSRRRYANAYSVRKPVASRRYKKRRRR